MDGRPEIDFERINRGLGVHELVARQNATKHAPARFCGTDCRESYREDRIAGKLHAPVQMNGQTVHYLDMCAQLKVCAACQSKLEK